MSTDRTLDNDSLRDRAILRLKKQRDFKIHLMIYLLVNTLLVVTWAATGAEFFWPMFPLFGWGIGVVANAWDAYGSDVPSESQIRHEMERLQHRT